MKKFDKVLKWGAVFLGIIATGFFVYDLVFFQELRPRMVSYGPVTALDEQKIIWTGVGLLIYMGFCLLSLWRLANFLRRSHKVGFLEIVLVAVAIIAFLFVFSDVALLSDIGNQHELNLPQPEWQILYPILAFQILAGIVLVVYHFLGFRQSNLEKTIAFDSNVFAVVQYIGILCGLMGLASAALGYIFPRGWRLDVHTVFSLILLLFPYALALAYWLFTKLREKNRILFDEKQQFDIGRSAFVTLVLDVLIMSALFILNFNNLGGITSINWLPVFLFSTLFLFSLGNLYFNQREA